MEIGTEIYMAPELLQPAGRCGGGIQHQQYTKQIDVYRYVVFIQMRGISIRPRYT